MRADRVVFSSPVLIAIDISKSYNHEEVELADGTKKNTLRWLTKAEAVNQLQDVRPRLNPGDHAWTHQSEANLKDIAFLLTRCELFCYFLTMGKSKILKPKNSQWYHQNPNKVVQLTMLKEHHSKKFSQGVDHAG